MGDIQPHQQLQGKVCGAKCAGKISQAGLLFNFDSYAQAGLLFFSIVNVHVYVHVCMHMYTCMCMLCMHVWYW